ncbi:hypothetical protein [Dehalobacter restrictus]|uniref:Uncharacterized protein n=1 Tax=Dehalobacter restrictus (strain DSM 9455 / PER-K23) TaxID=871738 RepID=A0ABN4BUU1_DEHRP|nr:hypothetical protein [Dehalobacter restrictus]AHF11181.1 hypothetical protein DEHRE_00145 [Dehalobacter restrictus DSM 9455]
MIRKNKDRWRTNYGKTIVDSYQSGTRYGKIGCAEVLIVKGWGVEGDAHGGDSDRQVSIFPVEALTKLPVEKKKEVLEDGYT